MQTLADILDALEASPRGPALHDLREEGPGELSRGQLLAAAGRLADRLRAEGLAGGDRVAVMGAAGAGWFVAALGSLRAGAVVVPLDAQMGADDLAHVLADAEPRVVLADERARERLDEIDRPEGCELAPLPEAGTDGDDAEPGERPDFDDDDPAVLFYTSGTTGRPKGVPLSHANLAFQLRTIRAAGLLDDDDRMLLALPLHHVYPFVFGLLLPLALGVPVILPAGRTGPRMLEAMREGGTTVLVGVPRLYEALDDGMQRRIARAPWPQRAYLRTAIAAAGALRRHLGLAWGRTLLRPMHRRVAPRLQLMASGGSPLDPALGRRLEAMGWELGIGYGLTESSPLLSMRVPGGGPLESVGRPVEGVELRLDASALEDEDDGGDRGEILAKGPGIFGGYRNLEEETRDAFTGEGWLRTGDIGSFDDDGHLYVHGRLSTMIVTPGGENLQPADVEERYAGHPFIEEIGILPREGKLAALAVPDMAALAEEDQGDPAEALRQAVDDRASELPSYMAISELRVARESLPRTRLGKIRRHELEERFEQADQEVEDSHGEPQPVEEMGADDRALLEDPTAREVWDWLCERYPDAGLHPGTSPRLDLDVDSMEWLELSLELRERTGVELDEDAIARVGTVRDLLEEARGADADGDGAADPVEEPFEILDEDERRWVEPLSRPLHALSVALWWLVALVMRLAWRVRVHGGERARLDGPLVYAPNHASFLDPFLLALALGTEGLGRNWWAGVSNVAFATPLHRAVCRLGRAVPVRPERGALRALAYASVVLGREHRLVWFPEGRRTEDGELQEFRPGLGKVLERIPVRVVPVFLEGSYEAWPIHRRLPRPGKLEVRFGEPVDVETLEQEGEGEHRAERIMDGLRARVARLRRVDDGEGD